MSIISSHGVDNSSARARRFAALATSYLNDPVAAKSDTAKVPLENLFRILEMFRYNAFADQPRRGVLALEGFGSRHSPRPVDPMWRTTIARALQSSLDASFGAVPKEQAIEELQESLRKLSVDGEVPKDKAEKVKTFLGTLATALA